jgi:hypothetical protein
MCMLKKYILTLLVLLFSIASYSQTNPLVVEKFIRLPADNVQSRLLINSINGLLNELPGPNKENEYVSKAYLPETSALLYEMKGMTEVGNGTKKNFFKCYLTNVTVIDSTDAIIQLSYMGIRDTIPLLRASFKLAAKKIGDKYCFYSLLKSNTTGWQVKNEGDFSVYYSAPVNWSKVNAYIKRAKEFDKELNAPAYVTKLYFCENLPYVMQLLGVEYKEDYNGYGQDDLSAFEDNTSLVLVGGNDSVPAVLDMHDLWHDRLHRVIPVDIINKPVDEGCAYLYGGSWGISWPEIFKQFKAFMGKDKDWLKAFNENKNFGPSQQTHLYVSYVINALIVQRIEKDKGFEAVKELLSCGKRVDGNENYFKALDKIAGITKANFNERIGKLVNGEGAK